MEATLVVVRLVVYLAGASLFGAPLFALYSHLAPGRLRTLLVACGAATAIAAAVSLAVQTGQMAGDPKAGLDPAILRDAAASGGLGVSILVRVGAGLAAVLAGLLLRPGRALWSVTAISGAAALAALPWSGHGGADEGTAGVLHLAADMAHLLAAGVWLGALAAFALLLARPGDPASARGLHRALRGFSGVGSATVAAIVASGLANSWFLLGPDHIAEVAHTPWGQLLLAKAAAFLGMLGLAALNRYRLTPRLGAALDRDPGASIAALRRSIAVESALAVAVLALVAVLGVQPPPATG